MTNQQPTPTKIYLKIDYEGQKVTWCKDQIKDTDVEYVRKGFHKRELSKAKRETAEEIVDKFGESVVAFENGEIELSKKLCLDIKQKYLIHD